MHAKGYSRSFIGEEIQIWMLSLLSHVRIETWKRGGFVFWKGDWVERTRVRALPCPKAAKSKCQGKYRSTKQSQHKLPAPWTDPHKHVLGTHLKTLNPRSSPNASCLKKPCPAPTAESKGDGVRNTEVSGVQAGGGDRTLDCKSTLNSVHSRRGPWTSDPPECWVHRHVPSHLFNVALWMEPRARCMLGKHSDTGLCSKFCHFFKKKFFFVCFMR